MSAPIEVLFDSLILQISCQLWRPLSDEEEHSLRNILEKVFLKAVFYHFPALKHLYILKCPLMLSKKYKIIILSK